MKLIDILLRHKDAIAERGEATNYFAMDADGRVFGYQAMPEPGIVSWSVPGIKNSTDGLGCLVRLDPIDVLEEWQDCIVTLKQYEAALAASKQHWNGEGLPPVGCRVETRFNGEWVEATVAYTGRPESSGAADTCKWKEALVFDCKTTRPFWADEFRPIRSEADKKRDEAATSIMKKLLLRREVAEAFVKDISEGKIPHIRIE